MGNIEEYGIKPLEKEKEVSVNDILADKKQSALFGEFIGIGRADRLFKGELTPKDMEELAGEKEEFLKRQKEVAELSKALTPELIRQLASNSSALEILIKVGGVEGVRNAITSQLDMLAMMDHGRFENMMDSYKRVVEKAEIANQQIEIRCKAHNITSKEYLKILAETPDEKERQEKLGNMIREKMGTMKGWAIKRKTIERKAAERNKEISDKAEEIDFKQDIDQLRADYDKELEGIGDLLAASINEDKDIRKAFSNTVTNEKAPKGEQLMGFKEMRGMMQSEDDLKKEFTEQFKEAQGKDTTLTKDKFAASYLKNKMGNKKGKWSDIVKEFLVVSMRNF